MKEAKVKREIENGGRGGGRSWPCFKPGFISLVLNKRI